MTNYNQTDTPTLPTDESIRNKRAVIIVIIVIILLLALAISLFIFLLSPGTQLETVARLRDIFIIFMAFESLLIGIALIILMTQLARLINLLNNEVKPILNSTNETVNTLRGTTTFLGNNLVEPVLKLNEYLAGMQQFFKLFNIKKRT